jgi:hypothetical protein
MALGRVVTSVIEVACVAAPAVLFFFVVIGVYGVHAAIAGLIIFIATAFWIIRGAAKKGGADYEA